MSSFIPTSVGSFEYTTAKGESRTAEVFEKDGSLCVKIGVVTKSVDQIKTWKEPEVVVSVVSEVEETTEVVVPVVSEVEETTEVVAPVVSEETSVPSFRIQSESTKTILNAFLGSQKVTRKDIQIEDGNLLGVVLHNLNKKGVIRKVERGAYTLNVPESTILLAFQEYTEREKERENPTVREPKKRGRPAKVKEPVAF